MRAYATSSSTSDKIQSTLADLDAILGARGSIAQVPCLPLADDAPRKERSRSCKPQTSGGPGDLGAGIEETKDEEDEQQAQQQQQPANQASRVSVSPEAVAALAEAEAKRAAANGTTPNRALQRELVSAAGDGLRVCERSCHAPLTCRAVRNQEDSAVPCCDSKERLVEQAQQLSKGQ